ncbi:MAG: tetratricopeptide repeat protein [Planctomycetota bacterium]|nr:tetratricopeptide repeat protein [Planctomycetota bacterium]
MASRCASEVDEDAPEGGRAAIRPSRVSRWRLWVLVGVHVAVAAHIAHWWMKGSTLTPLEPSESVELATRGVLNAGAIFFGLAILSTAVFGRFFCGWACHLVAVQDGCRWLLEKAGLRPRPVNLGLLGLIPLAVFVYMFLAPYLPRIEQGLGLGVEHTEFTTSGFWDTFPGLWMSILTFLVGGFLMVWFLGAKGFCTYACPYGAVFGVVDQLAPIRIRVTDACSGCGHCTAVCTSNVRVHQEVRDWKAIVDPGCMKCLDCVSVCPKDALYVGFGAPAIVTARKREPKGGRVSWGERAVRVAAAAAFLWGMFLVLMSRQGTVESKWATELAVGSLAIALLFAGKAERRGGPSLGEDLLSAAAFLIALYGLRGYALLPWSDAEVSLLLALGLAALFALSVVYAWRTLRRSELRLQTWTLVTGGARTKAGTVVLLATLPFTAVVGVATKAQLEHAQRVHEEQQAAEKAREEALAQSQRAAAELTAARADYDRGVAAAQSGRFPEAIAAFEAALQRAPQFQEARENLAGMYCATGRFRDGIVLYRQSLAARPDDPDTHALLGQAYAQDGDLASAEEHWREALRLNPDHVGAHLGLAVLCEERGDSAGAQAHRQAAQRGR